MIHLLFFCNSPATYDSIFCFPHRAKKKAKPLNLKIHSSVAGSCENLPTQRSPLHSDHSLRSFFFPSLVPSTPPVHAETPSASMYQHLSRYTPPTAVCLVLSYTKESGLTFIMTML